MLPERAALAAALLRDLAPLAVTAATEGRLMEATRLVAMAVLEADLAARRLEDLVAPEDLAAVMELAAS